MTLPTSTTETFPVVDGLPLRLSFTPDAIREHFDSDDEFDVDSMTDEQLGEVGSIALQDDGLYRAFHEALEWAMKEVLS